MEATQDIIKANISPTQCLKILRELSKKDHCFIDEIADFLQEDFDNFIIGKTLSSIDNRIITYDIGDYIKKILNKGFDYPIQWVI